MDRSRHPDDTRSVAAYASVTGAERAVSHLVGLGYEEVDVAIAPREFRPVDQQVLRQRLRRGVVWGALAGAAVATLVELERRIGMSSVVTSVLPAVAIGVLAGVVLGLAIATARHLRERTRAFGPEHERLSPTRYEVVVEKAPGRARHRLAKWWDPSAPPPGAQRTA